MGKFFEEMPLRHKLTVMLSVFVLGFVWLVQGQVSDVMERRAEGERLLAVADLSVATNAVVHALQSERTLATAYVESAGSRFAMELAQQQSVTDRRLQDFASRRQDALAGSGHHWLEGALNAIDARLDLLDGTRAAISARQVNVADELEYYELLNAAFLDVAAILPKLSSAGSITNSGLAYMALLHSKERVARESAAIAGVFVADTMTPGTRARIQDLAAAQDVYIETFASLATPAQVAAFVETMDAHPVAETRRMRDVLISSPDLAGFGVDPGHWIRVQSERLDLFREVENRLSNELRVEVAGLRDDASVSVRTAVLISSAVLIYSIVFAIAMARTILSQLGADPQHLQSIVNAIANDELYNDPDEKATGVFKDVLLMQSKLRRRIEADRAALAENSRIRQALNNVDGNVMITDHDRKIVYVNEAATQLFKTIETSIRTDLPEFSAFNLLGQSVDLFRGQGFQEGRFLEELMAAHCAEIDLGGRTLKVVVNPVFAESGEQLGAVIEWTDRTEEVAMENEVNHVVGRALAGDLSHRIEMSDKSGFIRQLSTNINRLVDVAERVINDTVRVLGAMANGRLDERIENDYEGSFEQLKRDANATVARLTEVVGAILQSANSVKAGVEEISQGNIHLSQRTEEQAASLEETAASMEEMTTTVRQNAENAEQANQLARAARKHAEKGGSVVSQAVVAMREINESSRKIADIIGVIDEIAFQTNLLALNASVEAARAGEQGRGFAVVASEVRNLAGRSATAAREIKDLIEDSGSKVDEGSRLVNESGATLEEIVNGVRRVTDIVSDIATASQEQSIGIEEVSKSILQMDDLTQQNAALVEEAAAASESLGDQAAELSRMMAFFAASAAAQAQKSTPAVRVSSERRGADRPWTSAAANDVSSVPPARRLAASDIRQDFDDAEWEEF